MEVHSLDAYVSVRNENGKVTVQINSCTASFTNKQLKDFIEALRITKIGR